MVAGIPLLPMKPGPKFKIDAKAKRVVYAWLSAGGSLHDAADYLEVDYKTIYRMRQIDSEFAKGVNKAIKAGKKKLLDKMGKAKPWQAAAWMLERRWGKQFGKHEHVDHTSGGQPIKIEVRYNKPPQLIDQAARITASN